MLEKLLELLVGLALAATAGTGGIATAQDASANADANAPFSVTEKIEWALAQRAQASENAAQVDAAEAAADGLETAIGAIEHAMELAPDAADAGLQQAWDSVSSAGADAAGSHIPDGVPTGRP
jgi:hypothetical protein